MTGRFAHDPSCGATLLADGRTRFRLWAPAQEEVWLALEDGPLLPMRDSADGWFTVDADCGAGTRYRYQLVDEMLVPDPASRFQPEDVHGPSMVVDPRAYAWRNPQWMGRPWRETVLYELHAGTMGGFAGVARELPRLRRLGITAVELMPVADFPGRHNWGYDGVLPYAPDSAYGTPDDLKALVDAAHGHGLMIFLDVVYNHFGPDGNFLHSYAPQFFRDDHQTPWGPAIDFRRKEVRAFFTNNVLYWLMEYRFDGLRFDAVHAIEDQSWIDEMAATVRLTVEPGRQVHLVLEHHNDASHLERDVDAQWNDDGHNVLHVLLTGEHGGYYGDYGDHPAQKLARCLAEGWVYQGEMSHYLGGSRGSPSGHLPPTAHVLFLQNHDQVGNRAFGERLTVLVDPAALEAAIALLLLCPQIPLLFMGEETASRSPFLYFTDHHDGLADAVREGRRREFARFPQFADPVTRARIPDPNAPRTFQDSIPLADPERAASRSALYATLIALRQRAIVPLLTAPAQRGSAAKRTNAAREATRVRGAPPGSIAAPDPHPTRSARRPLPQAGEVNGGVQAAAHAIGPKAVLVRWQFAQAALTLATNLGTDAVPLETIPTGRLLFASRALTSDAILPATCTAAWLDGLQ